MVPRQFCGLTDPNTKQTPRHTGVISDIERPDMENDKTELFRAVEGLFTIGSGLNSAEYQQRLDDAITALWKALPHKDLPESGLTGTTEDIVVDIPDEQPELVNHPLHYGGEDNIYEHLKVARALGWIWDAHVYSATKYLWRLGLKHGAETLTDLKKAVWYLNERIKTEEANQKAEER